jgi:isopenicillin-N epimerase
MTGLPPLVADSPQWYAQMSALPLPIAPAAAPTLKERLYDEFRIEIPITVWRDRPAVRISVQGYNTAADLDALVDALTACLQP